MLNQPREQTQFMVQEQNQVEMETDPVDRETDSHGVTQTGQTRKCQCWKQEGGGKVGKPGARLF